MKVTLTEAEAILSKLFDGIAVHIETVPIDTACLEMAAATIGHKNKILAIKHYRSVCPSMGLAEAKNAVEAAMVKYPPA